MRAMIKLEKKHFLVFGLLVLFVGGGSWGAKRFFTARVFEVGGVSFKYPAVLEVEKSSEECFSYFFQSNLFLLEDLKIYFAGFPTAMLTGEDGRETSLEEYVEKMNLFSKREEIKELSGVGGRGFGKMIVFSGKFGEEFEGEQVFFNVKRRIFNYLVIFKNRGPGDGLRKLLAKQVARAFIGSLEVDEEEAGFLTAAEAEKIVLGLDEVLEWGAALGWKRASVVAEGEAEGKWRVHVFESLDDHTATMNWFYVDKKTGKVTKEFDF